MRFEAECHRLSDLFDGNHELVVYDEKGIELRRLDHLIILGGQTLGEAIEAELHPGEQACLRRKRSTEAAAV